jgi:hypothetical protein
MSKKRTHQKLTNIPAPFMQGLYSVQAVSIHPDLGDVTIYRETAAEAVAWKTKQAATGQFSRFFLRHAINAWDVYTGDGKLEHLCDDINAGDDREITDACSVDRAEFVARARKQIGERFTCAVALEAHRDACAADHSNFVVLSQLLLLNGAAADKQHMCVVESRDWQCRVIGLFIDVEKLSTAAIDKFLDRYPYLVKSWPLSGSHHLNVLATRLSTIRQDYLADVVGQLMHNESTAIAAKFNVLAASDAQRKQLADKLVQTLAGAIEIEKVGGPELFDEEQVANKRHELLEAYTSVFAA